MVSAQSAADSPYRREKGQRRVLHSINPIKEYSMKKYAIILAIMILFVSVSGAVAADKMLTATIDSVTVANDKNGAEYVRLIVLEPKDSDGVTYVTGTPVMCFGSLADQAKALKKGDKLRAVVQESEYQGKNSYTLLAWPTK
jgi:hypothetical protein